jgi:hypothetical protein
MDMKYEWRKVEKEYYLPKTKPTLIKIKPMKFFIVDGKGDPNTSQDFKNAIETLYGLSYGIRMMPKSGVTPKGYFEYTVYPLEGVWDMENAPVNHEKLNKDEFIYSLMIRQPDFVDNALVLDIINKTKQKKSELNFDKVRFEQIDEGLCVQMMHLGSYDDEPKSFALMDEFCKANNLIRTSHTHREIYMSDPRKGSVDKRKTIIRFMVKYNNKND